MSRVHVKQQEVNMNTNMVTLVTVEQTSNNICGASLTVLDISDLCFLRRFCKP